MPEEIKKQNRPYVFGNDLINRFITVGLLPSTTKRIDFRIDENEFVYVTAEFAIGTQQLQEIVDGLPNV